MNRMLLVLGLVLAALFLALAAFSPAAYAGPVATTYTLTITPPANGKIVASPAMPGTGYPAGSTVSLMATANPGFMFSAWTGPNGAEVQPGILTVLGSGTILMNGNKTISAAFVSTGTTPPTGTIVINNNRSVTNTPNVTLALTWDDGVGGSGVSRMRFSDDGAHWTVWEPWRRRGPTHCPAGTVTKPCGSSTWTRRTTGRRSTVTTSGWTPSRPREASSSTTTPRPRAARK